MRPDCLLILAGASGEKRLEHSGDPVHVDAALGVCECREKEHKYSEVTVHLEYFEPRAPFSDAFRFLFISLSVFAQINEFEFPLSF